MPKIRPEPPAPAGATPLAGRRVLVAEDEYLLAYDLADMLEERGAEVAGPVGRVAEALALLRGGPAPDAAILDINLQGEKVYPVADALRGSGVPFVFTTGYEAWAIPSVYEDVPRVEKPVEAEHLLALLHRLLAGAR